MQIGTKLVHKLIMDQHKLIKYTTTQIWEKSLVSSLYYILQMVMKITSKWFKFPRFPSDNSKLSSDEYCYFQLKKLSLEKMIPLTYQAFKLGCLNLFVRCFEGQNLKYYFD
jgi:hypothetical protein